MLGKSKNELWNYLESLFILTSIYDSETQSVAFQMLDRFKYGNGQNYHSSNLSAKVMTSNTMKNFMKKFGKILNDKLKLTNGSINNMEINLQSLRPVFNSLYHSFHGLQICINDTEQTKIKIKNFDFNPSTGDWTASFQKRHRGFAAWWILQNCDNYKPFITEIKIISRLKGNIYD